MSKLKQLKRMLILATIICSNTQTQAQTEPAGAEPAAQSYTEDREFLGEENARTLLTMARQHMRHHNYQRAITLLSKAVQLDSDDPDVHALFAAAMQEKLEHQSEKDPALFNRCIKEWLIVVRNECGDEKGMTYKGLGLGAGYYQDEERVQEGKRNLKILTGYIPRPWETDSRYLLKVLKPTDTSVSAIIKMPELGDEKNKKKTKTGNK